MSTSQNATTALEKSDKPQQLAAFGELSVQGIVDRKRKILEVMKSVMKDGDHYGKIPGCGDKPALFKSGAEILATTFALAPEFAITKTDVGGGHREYEITCTLVHIPTGFRVGSGVGSCSTMESKYRWRKARADRKCPDCGAATILRSKNAPEWFCWAKKGGCGATFQLDDVAITSQQVGEDKVENPDLADQYNTVLKMAKKRAQVDATLTAVGASDLLTQDIEDLAPASRPTADDAEFTEQRTNQNQGPRDAELNEICIALILDIDAQKSPDEVRALAPRFKELPKGTAARSRAYEAYQRRIEQTTAQEAA